jgi:hypothetical protein
MRLIEYFPLENGKGDRRDYLACGELYENGLWPEDALARR